MEMNNSPIYGEHFLIIFRTIFSFFLLSLIYYGIIIFLGLFAFTSLHFLSCVLFNQKHSCFQFMTFKVLILFNLKSSFMGSAIEIVEIFREYRKLHYNYITTIICNNKFVIQ